MNKYKNAIKFNINQAVNDPDFGTALALSYLSMLIRFICVGFIGYRGIKYYSKKLRLANDRIRELENNRSEEDE